MLLRKAVDPKVDSLRRVPLLAGCTESEFAEIARLVDRFDVEAGTVLMRQGKPGQECFLVVDGSARVSVEGRTVGTIGPGELVGELALIDHQGREATVTAATPMCLYVLDPRSFSSLLGRFPHVMRRFAASLESRVREAETSRAA